MKQLQRQKQAFDAIVKKYHLDDEKTADAIADFILTQSEGFVSLDVFAKRFAMPVDDAKLFLSFIQKGLRFKEDVLDKQQE